MGYKAAGLHYIKATASYNVMVKYACDRGEEVGGDNTSLFDNRTHCSLVVID
jgi:hypothetical protein